MTELQPFHAGIDIGEGPRWHNGRLWFSDFYRHGVFTVDLDGNETLIVTVEGQPSGLGWMPDGTLLIVSMRDQRLLRLDGDGSLSEHADLSGLATGHCNDMVVAADGTAYVGYFGFDLESGETPAPARLIAVSSDGSPRAVDGELLFPNGVVITPDDKTLIVAETFGSRFGAFTITDDGDLVDQRIWAETPGLVPDGCCLDADGGIWFADPVGAGVYRVIEGGEITRSIPTSQPAIACMLGGDDLRTLFVLSSPGTHPDDVAGKGGSLIETVIVDSPAAGRP